MITVYAGHDPKQALRSKYTSGLPGMSVIDFTFEELPHAMNTQVQAAAPRSAGSVFH
jgi:hypothetical protein